MPGQRRDVPGRRRPFRPPVRRGHRRLPAARPDRRHNRRRGRELGRDQRRVRLLRAERPDGLRRALHVPPARVGIVSGVLTGKTALVTGASSGIGRATALALAKAGASVALVARRAERLKDLSAQIEAAGGRALARPADVTDETEAAQSVEDTVTHFGGLDILVNAAGMTQTGKVENADIKDWRYVFELNFWAGFYTARAAIPALKASGGGDIVNISSTAFASQVA